MIKEIIILAIAVLAVSQAVPVEESEPKIVPVAVPVESLSDAGAESDGDLVPDATSWGGWGGYGRGYGWGRGHGGGWNRGWGGYGGWGHGGGYGGWGRGHYWG